MSRMLFVNLAVESKEKSVEFFTKLGFTFNPNFTDDKSTCMIVNDSAFVMLLEKDKFATFTSKALVDPRQQVQGLFSVNCESREAVDQMVKTALEAGGSVAQPVQDLGFMYGHSFDDLDGHSWECFWMDPAAAQG